MPPAREQTQFLDVSSRDLAERRWHAVVQPRALGREEVPLDQALGRVLAEDIFAPIDVPGFDRANLDGYALRAEDSFGAAEETPRLFAINREDLTPGTIPRLVVAPGTATPISTGGMLPRGADSVAMVEITLLRGDHLLVKKPITPGAGVSFAGTDMARGELVLRRGTRLTARETGVIAALGLAFVSVVRRAVVAVLSTGDEIVPVGNPLPLGSVYDSNGVILSDSIREAGAVPLPLGIVGDDEDLLARCLDRGLALADLVLLSGGTSKGAGDLSFRVLHGRSPGIVVHGVALKPGKPVCLGAVGSTPVAILPGFPTSAVFTFHEFVAPLLRIMGGLQTEVSSTLPARMATRVNSERGRTEYLLVSLLDGPHGPSAYPMGKGSGSVTAFSRADGFVKIPYEQEYVDLGDPVRVTPIGLGTPPADLVAIGSHCSGLDFLLGRLADRGFVSKTIWVGSQGGVLASSRGECDLAGVHLLDPETDRYNLSFLPEGVKLLMGYGRMQGIVTRIDDIRFHESDPCTWLDDPSIVMVHRNRGSGTRILIDGLLGGRRPPGFAVEARSHNSVCASVARGASDWGVAIEPVARLYGLRFQPLRAERYDFMIPEARWDRPPLVAFRDVLASEETRRELMRRGFLADNPS